MLRLSRTAAPDSSAPRTAFRFLSHCTLWQQAHRNAVSSSAISIRELLVPEGPTTHGKKQMGRGFGERLDVSVGTMSVVASESTASGTGRCQCQANRCVISRRSPPPAVCYGNSVSPNRVHVTLQSDGAACTGLNLCDTAHSGLIREQVASASMHRSLASERNKRRTYRATTTAALSVRFRRSALNEIARAKSCGQATTTRGSATTHLCPRIVLAHVHHDLREAGPARGAAAGRDLHIAGHHNTSARTLYSTARAVLAAAAAAAVVGSAAKKAGRASVGGCLGQEACNR